MNPDFAASTMKGCDPKLEPILLVLKAINAEQSSFEERRRSGHSARRELEK